jgi:diadenosine tetraphosphate (Ap4A) HIT family hydrolase
MTDWREDRIGSALRGENPTVIARMPGGFAVMGDPQWLPGYCVLLTDNPEAERLSDLSRIERSAYLASMADLGEAVESACREADPAFRRVNLEILGNADAFLYAHVWPRYDWEPPELVNRAVWLYPIEKWRDEATALGPEYDALRTAITTYVTVGAVSLRT